MSDSFETELSKLEDLFRSGFIIEDEYRQRKDELLGAAAGKPSAAPGEKPKEDPKEEEKATEKHAHAEGEECSCEPKQASDGEDDPDYQEEEEEDDEDIYWECDQCSKEIHGVRFHCFHCSSGDGFDLCRQCRVAGTAKHDADHKFQLVRPFDTPLDSVKDFLIFTLQTETEQVRILHPYPGVTEFEIKYGPKTLLFSSVDATQSEKIIQALPPDIKIVHLSEEDSAKELADKEKFAVQLVEGKSYTELELDFLVRTLDLSSEDAARALESAGGDLSLAIADDGGDEGQED